MRWWIECLIRELPPLTVNAPSAWHICGTSRACLGSPSALSRTPVVLIRPTTLSQQHTVDGAFAIIPEPEALPEGAVLHQTINAWVGPSFVTCGNAGRLGWRLALPSRQRHWAECCH